MKTLIMITIGLTLGCFLYQLVSGYQDYQAAFERSIFGIFGAMSYHIINKWN